MTKIADRIKARLKVLGLTPRGASLRAGRQPYTVRDILSGKNENPKADLVLDLAAALMCSTDYLLGLTDEPGASPGVTIDPQLAEVIRRIPQDKRAMVRGMLEAAAEPSHKPRKRKN